MLVESGSHPSPIPLPAPAFPAMVQASPVNPLPARSPSGVGGRVGSGPLLSLEAFLASEGGASPRPEPLSWPPADRPAGPVGHGPGASPAAVLPAPAGVTAALASAPASLVPAAPTLAAAAPLPPSPRTRYRSIDGSGNGPSGSTVNAVGTDFSRLGPARFADGVGSMISGAPNARAISNAVVAGQGEVANPEGLSGMMYAWGQFIDHDLDLMRSDGVTSIAIEIPAGDPVLQGTTIPMTRTVIDPLTGVAGRPAAAVNAITGWLDGSMVYGSDATTASSLRTADGHLLASAGANLPIVNGQFLAGDIRVQENPDLTALQTLFLREHNRLVDRLAQQHPNWSGDQLYQEARAIVGAEIAVITYQEFLPHLLGGKAIAPYRGFNPNVDARLSEEFAGAAFRFGHSIVSANLEKIGEQGQTLGTPVSLKDAFFQAPADFVADGGADALLRHLAADRSNALDVHLVDDLRNFLDVGPMAMDLAAINIQRGRDLGLGTLNQTRLALGLKAYRSFSEISADPATASALQSVYGTVDAVELWVGGLAERHVAGGMVGETFQRIIARQFQNLRDGDAFWYRNQGFDAGTLKEIEGTTLSKLILRNTDTAHMQADAFVYTERRGGQASGDAIADPLMPQLVVGSDGGDRLIGGAVDDWLVAGTGAQVLQGLGGRDTFVFSKPGIDAVILDYRPGVDRLRFESLGVPGPGGLQVQQIAGGTRLQFGGDALTLLGVTASAFRLTDVTVI